MECPYRSDEGLSPTSRKWNNKTQNHRDDLLTDWRQQHCYPEEISEEIITVLRRKNRTSLETGNY